MKALGALPHTEWLYRKEVRVPDTKLCCCDEAVRVPADLILAAETSRHARVWVKEGWI